ncbi:MAG: zinc metallopeptidase [Erysipelotrichaceae bacterium]
MPMFGLFDPTMIIILPALFFSMYAQFKVSSAFKKYSDISSVAGFTGYTLALEILKKAGINDVSVTNGANSEYGDHYDPSKKVIRLSNAVYGSNSITALGIAAHECGHAIQEARGYVPNKIRSALVPVTNIASMASIPLFIIGMFASIEALQWIGIIFFGFSTLFYLVTLPVEFDASGRAVAILNNYMDSDEVRGVKKVLSAAALTYLAAVLMSLLQLLRLIVLSRRDD